MLPLPLSQPPRSVCILRLSAIGDTTHMVPFVRSLQKQWPDCSICWVIGKAEYQLMRYMDGVEFIIFDKSGGLSSWNAFRQSMRTRQFDVLLHMQAALRASSLAVCIRAPIKLGFDKARAIDYQWLFINQQIAASTQQHVQQGFMAFAERLGLDPSELDWRFDVPAEILESAALKLGSDNNKEYVVINPCSSARRNNWRNWAPENYAPVIEHAHKHKLAVVLSGGPDAAELEFANQIQSLSPVAVINMVGKTSLAELYALIAKARVLIAPDTGPAHMGSLANTPTVGLYASSNPGRCGPVRWPELTVNKYPQALDRFLNKSEHDVAWGQRVRSPDVMSLITVPDVIEKLDQALSDSTP